MIRYDARITPARRVFDFKAPDLSLSLSALNSRNDSEGQSASPITEQHSIIMALTGTVVEVSGVRLRLGEHFTQNITERILSGNYEQDEMRGLSAILAPTDVVMEIGAGICFSSSHCAKVVGSENIYAFEANPELEAVIRDTYELNGVSPHLEICVLAHQGGERTFYLEESFLTSSLTSQGQRTRAVKVPAKLLNAEIARIQPSVLCHRHRRRGIRAVLGD